MPCVKCGWCCKNFLVFYNNHPGLEEFMEMRGFKKVWGDEKVIFKVKLRCKNYDGGCKIYEDRPEACRVYPENLGGLKRYLGPRCGYKNT